MARPEVRKVTDTIKERILTHMRGAGEGVDVYIQDVYKAAYETKGTPVRAMQQRLGARFTVINREYAAGKHHHGRIVPGDLKRTYRLVKG